MKKEKEYTLRFVSLFLFLFYPVDFFFFRIYFILFFILVFCSAFAHSVRIRNPQWVTHWVWNCQIIYQVVATMKCTTTTSWVHSYVWPKKESAEIKTSNELCFNFLTVKYTVFPKAFIDGLKHIPMYLKSKTIYSRCISTLDNLKTNK